MTVEKTNGGMGELNNFLTLISYVNSWLTCVFYISQICTNTVNLNQPCPGQYACNASAALTCLYGYCLQ